MDSNPKILLVDDNPINIRVAAKILRSHNYNISFAQSGAAALKKAYSIDFDLILLDIMMPEMDGYEVCEKLKTNPATQKVPIIFLTAKTETDDVVKAFELGGADYVTKPFNGNELLSRVETHIKLKRSLEQLENANTKLHESNDTKDKMFSIISHDLLGSFGSIRESLEMISNEEVVMDDKNLHSFIKAMSSSISSAYSLLENLLYWARNQQGRMVYQPKKLNLNSIIHDTYDLLGGVAKDKSIILKTNLIEQFEVFADKNAIKTILRNLVSNAIKFTEPGGTIIVKAKRHDKDSVLVSIKDTGIGMDEKTRENLFKSFKTDPRWGTKGEKGVGLGLVITKEFIEKHGGALWVESHESNLPLGKPGGSVFNFTLPQNKD